MFSTKTIKKALLQQQQKIDDKRKFIKKYPQIKINKIS